MPIADRQGSPEPSKPFSFRMPLAPADYLDRSPLLTDEERRGITSLLQLTPPHYLEFDRLVRQLSRVTQPLLDVLALFHEWRPKSRAVRQGFLTYVLNHVLQTNTLYWGWSQATWITVIDALPKRRDQAATTQTRSTPHYVLLYVAAYLFSETGPSPSSRGIPAHLMAEILLGRQWYSKLSIMCCKLGRRQDTPRTKGEEGFCLCADLHLVAESEPLSRSADAYHLRYPLWNGDRKERAGAG